MSARSRSLPFVALAFVCSSLPLAAQGQNTFQIWPERNGSAATYTSRAGGGSQQVEILVEVPGDLIAGVGDEGGVCRAYGYSAYLVDENLTTPEQVDVVFRNVDPTTGQPGTEIARLGPFLTPTTGSAARGTVLFSVTFTAPVVLPCEGTWYHGLELYAAPNWPASDGVGIYTAYYYPPPTRNVGDNPRNGAPNINWQVLSGVAQQVPQAATVRMGPIVATPVLSAGGIDLANTRQSPTGSPNYGAGGLFPDVAARTDGAELLVESNAHANGFAAGFLSFDLSPVSGLPLQGFTGQIWLHPALLLSLGSVPLSTTGSASIPVLAPGSIPPSAVGVKLTYQAVAFGGAAGAPAFSNATSSSF